MLHQNEGGIGKSIPDARKISWDRRDFLRTEGMDFPKLPEFWWSTDLLSLSMFLQGMDQKILPCGQVSIDSVKINPSLLMMREWLFWLWDGDKFFALKVILASPVLDSPFILKSNWKLWWKSWHLEFWKVAKEEKASAINLQFAGPL